MHAGDQNYPVGGDAVDTRRTPQFNGQVQSSAIGRPGQRPAPPAMPRWLAALAWTAGGLAFFFLLLRVGLSVSVSSDAANNALQSWDMLHGHLLLHGWIIGDATYYSFDLPVIAVTEMFLGLHTITVHVALALIYVIIAACCCVLAVTDSRGASRAARAGVVVAILAAPTLIFSLRWIPLGLPDHTGTTVFLLVSVILIDRWPARRFTAPLLLVILAAGQIGDVTVRYVTVPAILLVCLYRMLAARSVKTGDGLNFLAVALSVPLAIVVRAAMRHFGAYLFVTPKTTLASPSQWPHNIGLAWHVLRMIFGEQSPGWKVGTAEIFGAVCLVAAFIGLARVVWRWRTARAAEQLLAAVIVVNLGVYVLSVNASLRSPHDIITVLPAGAVLAARALIPARLTGRLTTLAVTGVSVVAALLPMAVVGAQNPPAVMPWAALSSSLEARGLTYGVGGYWDGSAVTLLSSGQVSIRTLKVVGNKIEPYMWETNTTWFDPSKHYANFLVVNVVGNDLNPPAERFFGKPVSSYRVGDWEVLIYDKNLLQDVAQAPMPRVS